MPNQIPPKKVTLKREERLVRVAELDLRGWSRSRIARELKVSQVQVTGDLKVLFERYRESSANDKAAELERQIRRLEAVIEQAFEGWERSMEDAVRVTCEKAPELPPREKAPKGVPSGRTSTTPAIILKLQTIKETTVRTGQSGDARYLSIIKDAVAEIARLRGLYPTEAADAGRDPGRDAPAGFWDAFMRAFTGPDQQGGSPEDRIKTLDGRVRPALPESVETVAGGPDRAET